MEGFEILIKHKGDLNKILTFRPQNTTTNISKGIPIAVNFFNEFLYKLSGKDQECLDHFKELYEKIPRGIDYFFMQEVYKDRLSGAVLKRFCTPIGVGRNEVDALSEHYLVPGLSSSRRDLTGLERDGHFVKMYYIGNDLKVETIIGLFNAKVRNAHILRRKKEKRLSLQLSIDDSKIPEDLQYSKYWTNLSISYHNQIKEKGIENRVKALNERFAAAENDFYNGVKLYRENKRRLNAIMKTNAIIDMLLKGATLYGEEISKDEYSTQLKEQLDYWNRIENDLNLIKRDTEQIRTKANLLLDEFRKLFKQESIPMPEDPVIIENWPTLG